MPNHRAAFLDLLSSIALATEDAEGAAVIIERVSADAATPL
jgi:hypothetical protein